ncbi:MAG: hypothetical protein ACKO7D_02140 [Bacteroidota bacterium]
MKISLTILFFFYYFSIFSQFVLTEKNLLNAKYLDTDSILYGENGTFYWYELNENKILRIGNYTTITEENYSAEFEEYIKFNTETGLIQENKNRNEWSIYYFSGHLKERIILDGNGKLQSRIAWLEKREKDKISYSKYIFAFYTNGVLINCDGKGCKNENIEKNRFILKTNDQKNN